MINLSVLLTDTVTTTEIDKKQRISDELYNLMEVLHIDDTTNYLVKTTITRVDNYATIQITPEVRSSWVSLDAKKINKALRKQLDEQNINNFIKPYIFPKDSSVARISQYISKKRKEDSLYFYKTESDTLTKLKIYDREYKLYENLAAIKKQITTSLSEENHSLGVMIIQWPSNAVVRLTTLKEIKPPIDQAKINTTSRRPKDNAPPPPPRDPRSRCDHKSDPICEIKNGEYTGKRVVYCYNKDDKIIDVETVTNCDADCKCVGTKNQ